MSKLDNFKNWSYPYWNQINRNIGYITIEEQEKIKNTKIAILGVGGLGGSVAEQLVRSGNENLVICDNDIFEESNLNRQLCKIQDLGKRKIDVLEQLLYRINSGIIIKKYTNIDENNISDVLKDVKVVNLALDDPLASIIITRYCRKEKIPIIESWAVPYLYAWWFTDENSDYETIYELKTKDKSIQEIRNSDKTVLLKAYQSLIPKILKLPGFSEFIDREKGILNQMLRGDIPLRSLAPIVRLSASYLAFDLIYSGILNIKKKILAPHIIGYDYMKMEQIKISL